MIVCAAIRLSEDFIICGVRHSDCYETLFKTRCLYNRKNIEEGFITNNNNFLNRREAFKIAHSIGQMSDTVYQFKIENHDYQLYSEDLY